MCRERVAELEPDERQNTAYALSSGKGKWSEEALSWLGSPGGVRVTMG